MRLGKIKLIYPFLLNSRKRLKKGFTIIEILVAVTVLTVGVLGVSGFFAISSKVTRSANYTTTASNLAQGLIDNQLAKSYEELNVGNGTKTPFSIVPDDPYDMYSYQINISLIDKDLAPSSDVGLKKINVFVYWTEGDVEKHVEMSTIKSSQS